MQAFGVLDRYIGKTIFTTIMMTLFMLVSLSGIIKFVDQLKKPGKGATTRWVQGCIPCSACQKMCRSSSRWRPCWRAAGAGDAGTAQRTGCDAGIGLYPFAGGAVGHENCDPTGAVDHGDWRVGGTAGRTDGA